jgi:hypothetical protein
MTPWDASDATGKTKRATTPATKKQWKTVANAVLAKTGDEGQAIRIASAAVRDHPSHKKVSGTVVASGNRKRS